MSVVGIDFGTSKCVVVGIHSGEVKVVVNEVSNRKTPTMVGYGDRRRYIGEAAASRIASHFQNTITGTVLKKLIGKKFSYPEVQKEIAHSPLKFVRGEDDSILIEVDHEDQKVLVSIEGAAAALFGHLKRTAESYLGCAASDCVISVPSFFTDSQRRALIDSARIGGFQVLGLMNETTSVALQYGLLRSLPKEKTTRVMFFDLGYAHLNTAIVNLKEGELTVAGCYTDPNLGGRDFDSIVAEFMIEHIKKTANLDVKSNRKAYARVLKEAENIKKVLSANSEVHWGIECLMDDKDVKGVVNRSDLEAVAQPLLDRLVVAVEKLLSICKLTVKDIDSVEIIGGAVRIPVVASKLESFIGFPVSRTCDGDESVGRGCALQSALLSPKFKVLDFKVNDISPYPIEVLHGDIGQSPEGISIMFEQFNPTPSLKAMSFKRDAPLEVSFRYQSLDNIVESTDAMISTYKITGIPKADVPENKARIKLRMKLDVSGIVSVAGATMTEDYWVDEVVETPVKAAEPKPTESDAKMDTSETDASSSAAQEDTAMETEPSQDAAATPSESDKMDVDTAEKDKKPATEKTVVKKKKTRKVELPIEAICYGSLSKQKYQACVDLEMKMAQTDKTVIYTLAKKNDLESFCYEIRDKVQFEAVETASEDDKTRFLQLVDETEDWLYNEGYDTSAADYVDRLVTLKKQSEPLLKKPEPEPVPEPVQPAPSDPKVPEGSPEAKPESSSNAEDARQQ